ncbi:MAG: hypothetical protein K2O18_15090 [Oscillospiraceae bacterium]|nr:hypothetical protein [Oscillospiraceae bacterium]
MSSFRITTSMKMNTYRYNLNQSNTTLFNSSEKVQTHRKFNSYAEAPADATHAWIIRRDYMDNDAYRNNNSDTYTRFQTAWLAMGDMKNHLEDATGRTSILRGLDDPTAAAKQELGGVLINTSETIVQTMNGAKYGEEFVFSGTNGSQPPFSWDENGNLLYRGINLTPPDYNAGWKDHNQFTDIGGGKYRDANGDVFTIVDSTGATATSGYMKYEDGTIADDEGNHLPLYNNPPAADQKYPAADLTTGSIILGPGGPDGQLKDDVIGEGKLKKVSTADNWEWGARLNDEGIPEDFLKKYGDTLKTFEDAEGTTPAQEAEKAAKAAVGGREYNDLTTDEDREKYEKAYNATKAEYDSKKAWYEYFQNVRTLNKLAEEEQYADLGLGMEEITDENGNTKMVGSTVYNNAIPGIKMLGYGIDDDGDPKNLVLLMREFGELLSTCDNEGKYPNAGDKEKAFRLLAKYDEASSLTLSGYTYTDVQGKFLQANGSTLDGQSYNLNEERAALEDVDVADAISMFMWDYSCYSANLKIGTQLLSESLIDYMR